MENIENIEEVKEVITPKEPQEVKAPKTTKSSKTPKKGTKKEIPINEIIDLINNKKLTKKEACDRWEISGKTFTRIVKDHGYIYNQNLKKYEKEGHKEDPQELFKITYLIPKELHKALKLQAVFEGGTATEVIIKALENYIPAQTKDLARNYKGE